MLSMKNKFVFILGIYKGINNQIFGNIIVGENIVLIDYLNGSKIIGTQKE